jgi:hypothetical protein
MNANSELNQTATNPSTGTNITSSSTSTLFETTESTISSNLNQQNYVSTGFNPETMNNTTVDDNMEILSKVLVVGDVGVGKTR